LREEQGKMEELCQRSSFGSLIGRRYTFDRREDGVVRLGITHGGVDGEGLGEGRAGEEEGAESDEHGDGICFGWDESARKEKEWLWLWLLRRERRKEDRGLLGL
jgi:hypothetical protein